MKKQNGITLIALVITIVVLIILAAVSINLLLGQNGIITRAKDAKTLTEGTQANEQIALEEVSNQMEELIKSGNSSTANTGYPGGNYDDPYIPTGFTHTEGTWNDGYVIQDGIGNEFVWVPCVINQSQVKAGDTVVTFGKTLPTTTEYTDPLHSYNEYNMGLLPTDTTVPAEDSSVAEIRTSVGTYGGFYIARYEAGITGTTNNNSLDTKTVTDGTVKPLSKAGVGVWNYIIREDAITVSKAMIDSSSGVKSTLISGECWDTTLGWMVNASANKETNAGYDTDSTGKGNYTSSINTTGYYYAVNRIYDMAGNMWEWTTENCMDSSGYSYIVFRGGSYYDNSSYKPAAYRFTCVIGADLTIGSFRVVLYK